MYLSYTTAIPTGWRLDMTLPPLRAVLYGPVRRPSVSRVDLTVTVFRSQIFGPFIAHYDNLRPSQVSHMAFSVDRHHGKDAPLAGSARGHMWNGLCVSQSLEPTRASGRRSDFFATRPVFCQIRKGRQGGILFLPCGAVSALSTHEKQRMHCLKTGSTTQSSLIQLSSLPPANHRRPSSYKAVSCP